MNTDFCFKSKFSTLPYLEVLDRAVDEHALPIHPWSGRHEGVGPRGQNSFIILNRLTRIEKENHKKKMRLIDVLMYRATARTSCRSNGPLTAPSDSSFRSRVPIREAPASIIYLARFRDHGLGLSVDLDCLVAHEALHSRGVVVPSSRTVTVSVVGARHRQVIHVLIEEVLRYATHTQQY